ncbi:acetyltransferase [Planococcus versutus]|uniref:Acetyltransferase n=1 Tax=Planococcus versutus TaxID=1302659 RepID=A0A1B1S2Y2_9BACL|nr:acetyltransferase [Planococcus versutus]ANU27541.1 acetyltransferase [Planococcus versutus]
MKDKLLIIGASGHGKVVADVALKMKKWQRVAFLDDDKTLKKSLGLDVIGDSKDLKIYIDEWDVFVAIGNNSIREKVQEKLEAQNANIPVLIHPNAVIGEEVEISEGTVVMAGVVINCSTKIGKCCIINTGSTVDHDNLIGDYVHISPGANLAGTVKIGKSTWIGIGSSVNNNLNISKDIIIGAGATVINDLNDSGVYVGVPVRRL